MARRYGYPLSLISLALLLVGFAFHADAAVMIFRDRDAWQSALSGPIGSPFNFSNFSSQSFANGAINFGGFDLNTIGDAPRGTNFIAEGPFDDANDPSIDGSPYASMFLDSSTSAALRIHSPVIAFGADFSGAGAFNFTVFSLDATTQSFAGPPAGRNFFGFISSDAFNRIDFQYAGPQGESTTLGLDNVAFASSSIPEPASLLLLGMGTTLLGGYGCWKSRAKNKSVSPTHSS